MRVRRGMWVKALRAFRLGRVVLGVRSIAFPQTTSANLVIAYLLIFTFSVLFPCLFLLRCLSLLIHAFNLCELFFFHYLCMLFACLYLCTLFAFYLTLLNLSLILID